MKLRQLGLSALAMLAAAPASAAGGRGATLVAEPFQGKKVSIDGLLREWPGDMTALDETLEGSSGGDPRAAAQVGYDDKQLYLALKIVDADIVRTPAAGANEDHATLIVAFPKPSGGFTQHAVDVFPGNPGKVGGAVKLRGAVVSGAKVIEAPAKGGLEVEAAIPWSAFPEAARVRVGLRAAVQYVDVDGGRVQAKLSTAPQSAAAALPALRLAGEDGLATSLLKDKGLSETPVREAYGNVAGDGFVERVAQYGQYLTIVGPTYRGGTEFYFGELGVPEAGLRSLALQDLDGDGRDEVVLVKRAGDSDKHRESLSVLKLDADGAPTLVFAHEIAIATSEGRVQNAWSFVKADKGLAIEIAQDKASGFEPGSYREPTPGDMPSALLPWQSVISRRFAWDGSSFKPAGDKTGKPKIAPAERGASPRAPSGPPAPPPPRPPTADELLDRVYALYRKDRGVKEKKPVFDFVTDVAADNAPERVLVHDRDVVVFGKGYLGGAKYAFLTIGVKEGKDVLDVGARDLTGDGKAEIVVRGALHAKASKELGGDTVTRHALFVYQATDAGVRRIFAAETGRSLGDRHVLGSVRFVPAERGVSIELRAGRAIGFTEKTYPFPPDTTAAGGLEPLLLPWGDKRQQRYGYADGAYAAR
jgi:hypothetical protein